ncbi:MAG TPA: porphobilinogen synthase, partial [Acidimicrobiales bacterium]|nr:porphobilinogen synthase [Acidimicrobiales bacterium]
MFPAERPRRLRASAPLRRLVAETRLHPADLVAPLFVAEGLSGPRPIPSMPGQSQHSVDSLVAEAKRLAGLGVGGLILFGVPEAKDELGSGAWDPRGITQVALAELRAAVGDQLVVIADLCLDEYTTHGHCGVLTADGRVDNDATLELYGRVAVAQARAGAQVVAPSGMMDGQVGAIRSALDAEGHADVAILAYAAKYASGLYGPFRDAVQVEIAGGGDRRSYQMDPANRREALREARADVAQGADIVMVKPA